MLALALLLQLAAPAPQTPPPPRADSARDLVYASAALRDFIGRAAVENRAPPPTLSGYHATVETELALILRDSLGREIVGQIEQLAARAEWERNGRYELHVVGFRSQTAGAPYSALTWTKMYTVPTLYGNRLVLGMNDGIPRTRADTLAARKRVLKDSAAGRERGRSVHPLATDRDLYYRFSGGDTVATLYSLGRAIRLVRVHVEPVKRPQSNFASFQGELDFDADRHQLVRMRGRLVFVSNEKDPLLARGIGAVAIAYMEFENAEVAGKYWLPTYQRSEFQAQMGILGDVRPIYRIVSRFRNFTLFGDTLVTLAEMDTVPRVDSLPRTRSKLTFASRDSVSHFGQWQENLGIASAHVNGDDFNDLAPDIWKPTGKPRVDYWPTKSEDVFRYNRIEGMYTGVAGTVRFRDLMPGLVAKGTVGWAWAEQTARGAASVSLARGHWLQSARVERTLATTNDFLLAFETGLSIGPLITGDDENDYVDRWTAAYSVTRILGHLDRAILTTEAAYVEDRATPSRLRTMLTGGATQLLPNRNVLAGRYARFSSALEFHPRVTEESLSPGFGARLLYEAATGDLDWQRVEARLATRSYWRGLVIASKVDAGAVFASVIPPQLLYEMGGYADLPSYKYKEFGGDRAALGTGMVAYYFPVLRTPRRVWRVIIPGLSPGVGAGVQAGWTDASSPAARAALLALGGDGVTPISRPTDRIRGTMDFRATILSGAIGGGIARAIDHPDKWKPFFGFGLSF